MNKIQIKLNNSYIFKEKLSLGKTVIKGTIIEETVTTYVIRWENNAIFRWLKEEFNYKFEPIEELVIDKIT